METSRRPEAAAPRSRGILVWVLQTEQPPKRGLISLRTSYKNYILNLIGFSNEAKNDILCSSGVYSKNVKMAQYLKIYNLSLNDQINRYRKVFVMNPGTIPKKNSYRIQSNSLNMKKTTTNLKQILF